MSISLYLCLTWTISLQNGFKCHIQSESHQRQMLIFAENPGRFLHDYSKEFEAGYMMQLKRAHGTKRVEANKVYQEYIGDKEHIHMNATRWTTLSGFVQYLGKTGKCKIDQTEKGWYVAWIDRDPETIARQVSYFKALLLVVYFSVIIEHFSS